LALNNNQLSVMPELHPNLQHLSLSSNSITEIPYDLKLPRLKWLYLEDNQLTVMPELVLVRNLERLFLRGNPSISKIPDSFCEKKPNIRIRADPGTCANSKVGCCT